MLRRTIISTVSFIIFVSSWYFGIIYPPRCAAKNFLEALKNRDEERLANFVFPGEYDTYHDLYLKNGYNKRFKKYEKLKKLDSTPFPLPKQVTYKLEVEEDDQIFGFRKQNYKILVRHINNGWRVLRFSSENDATDLKIIRGMTYEDSEYEDPENVETKQKKTK